jgi:hypothetical protein
VLAQALSAQSSTNSKASIVVYQAPGEADGVLAAFAHQHVVDAVVSNDTDQVAYLTPVILFKMGRDGGCQQLKSINLVQAPVFSKLKLPQVSVHCFTNYKTHHQYHCSECVQIQVALVLGGCDYFKQKQVALSTAVKKVLQVSWATSDAGRIVSPADCRS